MNIETITWRLAQLSSLPFQERYVIGGTADEYIMDVELLENVDGLKYLVHRPEERSKFNDVQIEALENLFGYIDAHSDEALSCTSRENSAVLIRSSNVWREIRAKAAFALKTFGVCGELTVADIDRLSE